MKPISKNYKIPVGIRKDGDLYISRCESLDIYSQGVSLKEALGNIHEAITLFIEGCIEIGTLDQVISDCGLSVVQDQQFDIHECGSDDLHYLNVPISLIADAQNHAC